MRRAKKSVRTIVYDKAWFLELSSNLLENSIDSFWVRQIGLHREGYRVRLWILIGAGDGSNLRTS